jgi:hypothetical protein
MKGQNEQGNSAIEQALGESANAEYTAAQLRQNAGQIQAAAQRSAISQDRNIKYILSQGLAQAAASGGGASDPTVVNAFAQLAGEGAYRKAVALYEGQDKARALNDQASSKLYAAQLGIRAGDQIQSASNFASAGSLIQGGASLYSKYAGGSQP